VTDILCTVPRLLPPSPPLSKPRSANHPGFHLPGYNHHHLLSNKETCLYRKLLCGTLDRYSRSNSLLAQLLFSVSITFPSLPISSLPSFPASHQSSLRQSTYAATSRRIYKAGKSTRSSASSSPQTPTTKAQRQKSTDISIIPEIRNVS
jgi:hypothetical protein